eukprot:comp21363_c0_seq1/m.46024 comp21363_c0_seq1/g.46024  ORF comp21363_c0_seq1/g.46024 comp21363_c0_seq1/m.46024 type:complete len:219 (+) comp21363_c0_seq1:242-898(+)
MEDFDNSMKIIVVGNGGVGKTSLIQRFVNGTYTDTYKKTIGVDFLDKEHTAGNGEVVNMMIWDTAGQDEFETVTRVYYRGAAACIIAFSIIDRDSFEAVEKWKSKVDAECGDIAMVLMQNKMDLIDDAVVDIKEADRLAERLGMKVYRTCVKDNTNVNAIFDYLCDTYIAKRAKASNGDDVGAIAQPGRKKKNEDKGVLKATYESDAKKKKKKRCIIL